MHMLSLPEPVPTGVQIWLLPLDLEAPLALADWAVLSENEKARVHRFHHHADRVRSTATRAALRRILGEYLQLEAALLIFATNANQKPFLPDYPQLTFNVAHSGGYALVAMGQAQYLLSLGVDIECHRADIELEGVVDYAFTPLERSFLAGYCNTGSANSSSYTSAFFRQWTGKEAALKAVGVGISEHLQDVSIRPTDDGQLSVEGGMAEWAPLRGHTLNAPPGYAAAIAWQSGGSA